MELTYVGGEWVGAPKPYGIMLILQCPGRTEGVVGRPIVGQSGRLLRGWLSQAGIDNYYVTNLSKYVPPIGRNDPTKEEIEAGAEELEQELRDVSPRVIIGFGKYATDWLGFHGTQTKRHGRREDVDGVAKFGMFHPSYVMRKRGNRRAYAELEASCLAILARAKAALGEEDTARYTTHISERPFSLQCDTAAIDTETTSIDPRVAELKLSSHCRGDTVNVLEWSGQPHAPYLMVDTPIFHNALYDMVVLDDRLLSIHPPNDTMILAYDMDMDDLSLGGLATRLLGVPVTHFDSHVTVACAAEHAWLTWKLWNKLAPDTREKHLYEHIDRPLIPILYQCTRHGLGTDADGARSMLAVIDAKLDVLKESIQSISGVDNPNSDDQLRDAFARLGVKLLARKTDKKHEQALDAEVLKVCPHPLARLILHWRDIKYQKSHYLTKLFDGHISFLYKIHGAETGRISTEKPNGQNFPDAMRQLITPRSPENVFVIADYSGIEMVIAAELSGDRTMRQIFAEGRSPHRELAHRIWGSNYTERQYTAAKSGNFERLFGGGEKKLAEITGQPLSVAKDIFDAHGALYPEYAAWTEHIISQTRQTGYSENLWGRRRGLPEILSDERERRSHAERQAVNTPIQGTAGDMTKRAMVIYVGYDGPGRIAHQCHDEILVECEERDKDLCSSMLRMAMMEAAKEVIKSVPVGVEVYVSDRWMKK